MWIDINKISLSYSFAIVCGFVTMFLKADFSVWSLAVICLLLITYFITVYKYFKYNKIFLVSYGIFFITFLCLYIFTGLYIKNIASNIIFACGYIFLIYTLYLLIEYNSFAKILVRDKAQYIIENKFKYSFFPAVFFIIIYGLFLYLFALPAKELGIVATFILYSLFSFIIYFLMIFKLFKYKYAFKLLCLIDSKEIHFSSLTLLPLDDYDKFYQKNIEPYITNIYMYGYSIIPVKMDLNQTETKTETKKEEINKQILSDSIIQLDDIVKKAKENNILIYDSLSSIKSTLVKIDEMYKDNAQLTSYIVDIQTKYIPFLKQVTEIYIDNLDLPLSLTLDIQTKIENSVKSIKTAFDEILKSMFNMKKIDIESSIDVMNIQLMQDGLIKNYKKGR